MYPDVFVKFARAQADYGDLDVLPTGPFFYGMKTGEEIAVELEPGKIIVVKFLTVGELRPDGHRTVFFELNGQPREVIVRDRVAEGRSAPAEEYRRPEPSRPHRLADARRRHHHRRRAGADGRGGAEAARPRSDEDAEHGLRAGRRQGRAPAGAAGPDRRDEGTAARDRVGQERRAQSGRQYPALCLDRLPRRP